MSTRQQVEEAERRMKQAENALRAYLDRPAEAPADPKLHSALAAQLIKANDEYVRLVSELWR